jgi:hypothetical protein
MHHAGLRPLSFGEILDGAFVLYRRDFAAFLAISALAQAPALVCALALAATGAPAGSLEWIPVVVGTLLYLFASGALIRATSDAYGGAPVDVRAALAEARARYRLLLRSVLLPWLMIFVGFLLLVVPGVVATVRFFAIEQVAMLERATPAEVRRRSEYLADGAGWQIFWMLLVLFLISGLPDISREAYSGMVGNGGIVENVYLSFAIATALQIFTLPLTTAACTLLYFDRRVRKEALDVEAAMRRMSLAV